MNTSVRKARQAAKGLPVALITRDASRFDKTHFNAAELEYIDSEVKKKSKLILVKRHPVPFFLQIVDANRKNDHRHLEAFRKAGDQLTASLNRLKAKEVSGNLYRRQRRSSRLCGGYGSRKLPVSQVQIHS